MKSSIRLLSLVCAAAALYLPGARADDPSGPPPQPPSSAPDAKNPQSDDQQPPPPPPQGHHRRGRGMFNLAELTAKLKLTPGQQSQVGAIINNADQQMKALRQDDTLSEDDKRAKGREIIEGERGQIRAILSADQQKIFDGMARHGGAHGGPRTEPSPTPAPST